LTQAVFALWEDLSQTAKAFWKLVICGFRHQIVLCTVKHLSAKILPCPQILPAAETCGSHAQAVKFPLHAGNVALIRKAEIPIVADDQMFVYRDAH